MDKYRYLVDHFRSLGMSAKVFGFVLGALGAWFPGNEKVLDEIFMSRRYQTLFRKLCCADAIKVSVTFMLNTFQVFLNIKLF